MGAGILSAGSHPAVERRSLRLGRFTISRRGGSGRPGSGAMLTNETTRRPSVETGALPGGRTLHAIVCAQSAVEFAVWVTVLVVAYERGGASATGLAVEAQLVPAALCAPIVTAAGDRFPRRRVHRRRRLQRRAVVDPRQGLRYVATTPATAAILGYMGMAGLRPVLEDRPDHGTDRHARCGRCIGGDRYPHPAPARQCRDLHEPGVRRARLGGPRHLVGGSRRLPSGSTALADPRTTCSGAGATHGAGRHRDHPADVGTEFFLLLAGTAAVIVVSSHRSALAVAAVHRRRTSDDDSS